MGTAVAAGERAHLRQSQHRLLGVVTARAMKGQFAALVQEHITGPLGLQHTFHDIPEGEQANYAQGYTRDGKSVRVSMAPLATEAYGVRTTARDLLRFVEAHLGRIEMSPTMQRALPATRVGQFQAEPMTQALVWEWYRLRSRMMTSWSATVTRWC